MKNLITSAGVEQLTGREYFQLLCMGQEEAEDKAAELLAPVAGEPLNRATLGLILTQEPDGTLLLMAGGLGASGKWHSVEKRYDRSIVLLAVDKTIYHQTETEPEEDEEAEEEAGRQATLVGKTHTTPTAEDHSWTHPKITTADEDLEHLLEDWTSRNTF